MPPMLTEMPAVETVTFHQAAPATGSDSMTDRDPVSDSTADGALTSAWCWSKRKRFSDIVLTVVALPFAVPLIAILSAVSAIRFRRQPLFKQERYGVDEAPFSVLKIRSLPPTHGASLGKHELSEDGLCLWSRFLRSSHLDELPQILNVLNGTMSIVGPRPMIREVIELLDDDDRATRAKVRPGLTGPWQVSTMGAVPLHDYPYLDNDYVQHASATSDAKLIWYTVTTSIGSNLEPEKLLRRLRW